jgi:hypothetical protein
MKSFHLYEVKMLDGSRYRGEIVYKDDKMLVLNTRGKSDKTRMRLFFNSIISVLELGWQRAWPSH